MIRRLLPLMVLFLPLSTQAGVYRCEDAQGNVSYHETQPTGKDCSGARPPPPTSTEPGGRSLTEYTKKLDEQQSEAAQSAAESAKAEAVKQQNCNKASDRLTYLQDTGGRVYKTDDAGERSYLTDSQYQQELSGARALVAQTCD